MLKKVFYFIIGLLLMAIGFNTFLKDLNIVQGVSGIALMFERTLGYDTSLVILVANVIFLILGVIFLGVKVTRSCIPESILLNHSSNVYTLAVSSVKSVLPMITYSNPLSKREQGSLYINLTSSFSFKAFNCSLSIDNDV